MTGKIWLVSKLDETKRLAITLRQLEFLVKNAYMNSLTDLYDVEIEADYKFKDKAVDLLLGHGCTCKIINLHKLL